MHRVTASPSSVGLTGRQEEQPRVELQGREGAGGRENGGPL